MSDENRIRDERLEEARKHMSLIAFNLQKVMAPIDAAGVLMGAALGILTQRFGEAKAIEYLRELATELEEDDDDPKPTLRVVS